MANGIFAIVAILTNIYVCSNSRLVPGTAPALSVAVDHFVSWLAIMSPACFVLSCWQSVKRRKATSLPDAIRN